MFVKREIFSNVTSSRKYLVCRRMKVTLKRSILELQGNTIKYTLCICEANLKLEKPISLINREIFPSLLYDCSFASSFI